MITKFMTEVTVRFNPFSPTARSARLFLAQLPPTARKVIAVKTALLPRASTEKSFLNIKFKDGKDMTINCEKQAIDSIVEDVDRHSRKLQKEEDLSV